MERPRAEPVNAAMLGRGRAVITEAAEAGGRFADQAVIGTDAEGVRV